MSDLKYEIQKKTGIPAERLLEKEPMKGHTSFRVGGPADILAVCNDENELAKTLKFLDKNNIRHLLIGNGSNLLFSDAGYRGVLIKLTGNFASADVALSENSGIIIAGGAMMLSQISSLALGNSLTGFEFASGIPGTLGGAVFMNAGAYGGEIKDVLCDAKLITEDGSAIFQRTNAELDLGYRHSILQEDGAIVISARLELKKGDADTIKSRIMQLAKKRSAKQPVDFPSAGSTFKRPEGGYAAALIEQAGLKGMSIGAAEVSAKHSGFIINKGGATCSDILELINLVKERVYEKSGIMLEPEVRIIDE